MIAWNERQRGAFGARKAGNFLAAVPPVVQPAEQSHEYEASVRDNFFGIEVYGVGMLEIREARQTKGKTFSQLGRGRIAPQSLPSFRDNSEITVRERQHNDVRA